MDEQALWRFFKEVREAVGAANAGGGAQPYRSGPFIVSALAGDVELTVSDVSEEDAVLIAAELSDMGVKALVRSSTLCHACGKRVPAQGYCTACRARLE